MMVGFKAEQSSLLQVLQSRLVARAAFCAMEAQGRSSVE